MLDQGRRGLCESRRNCLKYLKRRWNRKGMRGSRDFKKGRVQAGSRGVDLKRCGGRNPLTNYANFKQTSYVVHASYMLFMLHASSAFKGFVCHICTSLFFKSKRKHFSNQKKCFYFTSKALFVVEKIKFQNSAFSNFMMSSNA